MIYFTSDQHYSHANIIKHCNRPFDNVHEMDEALIRNHNDVVKQGDIVYSLGDFSFKSSFEYLRSIVRRLNGNLFLLIGNHDNVRHLRRLLDEKLIIGLEHVKEIYIGKNPIWLSHYAHRVWNKSHHGAYHFFGHSHSGLEPYGRSIDVGVDNWKFRPISFEEAIKTMK